MYRRALTWFVRAMAMRSRAWVIFPPWTSDIARRKYEKETSSSDRAKARHIRSVRSRIGAKAVDVPICLAFDSKSLLVLLTFEHTKD